MQLTSFQKKGEAANTFIHGENNLGYLLTKNVLRKKIMPVLLEISAKSQTPLEENSCDTDKFVYCLEGEVEISVDDTTYNLASGDSLYFNASLKHTFVNKTALPVKCLVISAPPAL